MCEFVEEFDYTDYTAIEHLEASRVFPEAIFVSDFA
jgi:hypothetical protein